MWYTISKRGLFHIAEKWLNAHLMYQVYKDHEWKAIVRDIKTGKKYEVVSKVVGYRVQVTDTEIKSDNIVIDEKRVQV
jgi:hypothetical protein